MNAVYAVGLVWLFFCGLFVWALHRASFGEAPRHKGQADLAKKEFKWTRIALDEKNRMVRCGWGLHNGKWFFRIDLWKSGFRLTRQQHENTVSETCA